MLLVSIVSLSSVPIIADANTDGAAIMAARRIKDLIVFILGPPFFIYWPSFKTTDISIYIFSPSPVPSHQGRGMKTVIFIVSKHVFLNRPLQLAV
jgi:hypothetical protein